MLVESQGSAGPFRGHQAVKHFQSDVYSIQCLLSLLMAGMLYTVLRYLKPEGLKSVRCRAQNPWRYPPGPHALSLGHPARPASPASQPTSQHQLASQAGFGPDSDPHGSKSGSEGIPWQLFESRISWQPPNPAIMSKMARNIQGFGSGFLRLFLICPKWNTATLVG